MLIYLYAPGTVYWYEEPSVFSFSFMRVRAHHLCAALKRARAARTQHHSVWSIPRSAATTRGVRDEARLLSPPGTSYIPRKAR